MSQVKLTADSGGGTTSLKAPSSTTSNADVVLKLPVADGSANQVLKTDGSGQLSFTSNAGTTINNNADNRIITGSGTANTLEGESKLTFNGTILKVQDDAISGYGSQSGTLLVLEDTGDTSLEIGSGHNNTSSVFFGDTGASNKGQINYHNGTGGDAMSFHANGSERMRIVSDGKIGIGRADPVNFVDIARGSDEANILVVRGADNTSEYGAIGVDSGNMVITGGGASGINTGMVFRTAASGTETERMRIDSTGIIYVGGVGASATAGTLFFNDTSAHGSKIAQVNGSSALSFHTGSSQPERMRIGSDGAINAQGVYDQTTSSGANLNVASDGHIRRSTSSRRYKNTITDATHGLTELLKLKSVTFKGNEDGDTVFGGLIAEDVHNAGLTEFVQYDKDNEPDALAYGNMVALCVKAIQELTTKVAALEAA